LTAGATNLRPAATADLDVLSALGRSAFARPWSPASLREELARSDRAWLVVVVEDEVVGYGGVADLAGDAHVLTVVVAEEHRRRGHGLALVAALLELARERFAVDRATLEVRESNTAARALYRRVGFTEAGVRPGYYQDDQEGAVVLWSEDLAATLATLPSTCIGARPRTDSHHQPEEDAP
jgi:[ribosomal protein S18]-alanine N-acetyltransferase